MITIEGLHNFKSTILGQFILYNTCQITNKGGIYLINNYGWEQLKDGYFKFNVLDENYSNSFSILKTVILENFLKVDYIIIKLENSGSSVYFTINRQPSIVDDENGVISFYITKNDFIKSDGEPNFNEEYTMSYILNDASKELLPITDDGISSNIKKPSDQTKIGASFSLDTLPKINKKIFLKDDVKQIKSEGGEYEIYPKINDQKSNIIEINNSKIALPLSENSYIIKSLNKPAIRNNLMITIDDHSGENIHINSLPSGVSHFKRTIKLKETTNYPARNYYKRVDNNFDLKKCQNNYNTNIVLVSAITLVSMIIYFYKKT